MDDPMFNNCLADINANPEGVDKELKYAEATIKGLGISQAEVRQIALMYGPYKQLLAIDATTGGTASSAR
jgi:hypothetical protein